MEQHQADHETSLIQNYLIILPHEHYTINSSFFSSIQNYQNHQD
jgi:hypothetical protein